MNYQKIDPENIPIRLGRRFLNLFKRYPAISESLFFFLLLLAGDTLFFAGERFISLVPHPAWIIVLLTTVQYGTSSGLIAAFFATLFLYTFNLPVHHINEDIYEYLFRLSKLPNLWFICSVVLGEIRNQHLAKERQLKQAVQNHESHQQKLLHAYQTLDDQKSKMEKALAGQLKTFSTMYQAIKSLEALDVEKVTHGVEELVHTMLNANAFSLFFLQDNKLIVSLQHGWETHDQYKNKYDQNSNLFKEIVGNRAMVSINSEKGQLILDDDGLMAGPLIKPGTTDVFAMVKIEDMGFLDFNLSSITNFKVLCEWISNAYANAEQVEQLKTGAYVSPDFNLLANGFYEYQSKIMKALANRYKFDISMILITITNYEALGYEDYQKVPNAIGVATKKVLRATDMAFDYNNSGHEFAVVLPGTPLRDTTIVSDKMMKIVYAELARNKCPAQLSVKHNAIYACQSNLKIAGAA